MIDNMVPLEFSAILVEPICNKHWDIIQPCVSWSGTKEDPVVALCDLEELGDPISTTNQPLFVEYEESPSDISVLSEIVPRVDSKYSMRSSFKSLTNSVFNKLFLPIKGISLLGSSDDIDVSGCFPFNVVGCGNSRLTGADPAPEDLSVSESGKGVLLMRAELGSEQDTASFCRIEIVWSISLRVHDPGSSVFVSEVPW